MKRLSRLFIFILSFACLSLLTSSPARAVPWTLPWAPVPSSASTKSTKPSAILTYTLSPRQFSVIGTGMKNVAYTITYQRTGGKLTEALAGSGRAVRGLYGRKHYAGSQSSKYFIPHNVLSGHFQFDGVTLAGTNYSVNRDFVIKKGKLVFIN